MNVAVPTGLLSAERAIAVAAGVAVADRVVADVFPPRYEDADGALTLATVEVLLNQALRAGLGQYTEAAHRRWWLEGIVVGFAAATVDVLADAAHHCEYSVAERVTDMAAHVLSRVTPAQQDPSELVFGIVHAVNAHDDVSLSWALENLWHIPDSAPESERLAERYKRVLTAAVNTTCASWRLLLLLRESSED